MGRITGPIVTLASLLGASAFSQDIVFRPKTVLVPLAVRVVDANNNPVEGLRQQDFRIVEDGKPQEIAFFEPVHPDASAAPAASAGPEGKIVLVVLGRGRLDGPSHGLSALDEFLGRSIGPRDRVGIAAYDRISDITPDLASVRRLLSRYRSTNDLIENTLAEYLTGLTAMYWDGQTIIPSIQRKMDEVFSSPGVPPSRRVPMLYGPHEDRFADYRDLIRSTFESDLRRMVDKGRVRGHMDTLQLFTCVEYLRNLPGEKQLIYVTDQPPLAKHYGSRLDSLAELAADARVTISTFQVGGIQANFGPIGNNQEYDLHVGSTGPDSPNPFPGRTLDESISLETIRSVSARTGGMLSAYEYSAKGFERLERQWAATYVLAYYPTDPAPSHRQFHSISVTVSRPDATVRSRAGYFVSQPEAKSVDGKAREMLHAVLEDARTFTDLRIRAAVTATGSSLEVAVTVDCAGLHFEPVGDRYVATVGIAGVIGVVHSAVTERLSIPLAVRAASLADARRQRAVVTLTLPAGQRLSPVRVAVYDYGGDRLGSATANVK